MKKIILIASLLFAFAGLGIAQTTPLAKAPKKPARTVKTTEPAKPAAATPAPAPAKVHAAGPTKKDGSADMRFKANKEAKPAPATTHLKKDGTPDKRFKENKSKKTS